MNYLWEGQRKERKVFELSSTPRHCAHGDKKAEKTDSAKPAEATEISSLSLILKLNRVVDSGSWMNYFWQGKKTEGGNERKVFEFSSQSVFSPATAHTETKKLGKVTVQSPP